MVGEALQLERGDPCDILPLPRYILFTRNTLEAWLLCSNPVKYSVSFTHIATQVLWRYAVSTGKVTDVSEENSGFIFTDKQSQQWRVARSRNIMSWYQDNSVQFILISGHTMYKNIPFYLTWAAGMLHYCLYYTHRRIFAQGFKQYHKQIPPSVTQTLFILTESGGVLTTNNVVTYIFYPLYLFILNLPISSFFLIFTLHITLLYSHSHIPRLTNLILHAR